MAITIEKTFELEATASRTFDFMSDPERVAPCLPGVELVGVVGDPNDPLEAIYSGNVKVKVGPMMVAYKGEARLTERDAEKRTFAIVGKGKEKGGAGSAKMQLSAVISETDGRARVEVEATLDLTGKIVRFGRGMIQGVSDQLFDEFVDNVRANLEGASDEIPASADEAASHTGSTPSTPDTDATASDEAPPSSASATPTTLREATKPEGDGDGDCTGEATGAENAEAAAPPENATENAKADTMDEADEEARTAPHGDPKPSTPRSETVESLAPPTTPAGSAPPSSAMAKSRSPRSAGPPSKPVSALSLVFKVLWRMIRDFFVRIFGRD